MLFGLTHPVDRLKRIDDVERWVDIVLDEFEAGAWQKTGYTTWREYAHDRYYLPLPLDPGSREFDPQQVQDAMIWLWDGGFRLQHIAVALRLPNTGGLREAIEAAQDLYEDE